MRCPRCNAPKRVDLMHQTESHGGPAIQCPRCGEWYAVTPPAQAGELGWSAAL